MASNKFSQQELRQLMKERVQNRKENTRIDSPLAKYDQQNNLWCRVCNQIVNSDLLWSTHLISKTHKKKVEELKHKKFVSKTETSSNLVQNNPLKRTLENQESFIPSKNKIVKYNLETPEQNILNRESKQLKNDDKINDNINLSLPQDFFDDSIKQTFEHNSSNEPINSDSMINNEQSAKNLPKGFFDDPLLDAKVRKAPYNESIEAQFELFRKEIAEESLISQIIIDDDIEILERDKALTELDEQIENLAKVIQYQKKIEEIHKKNDDQMESNNRMIEEENSDSDSQIDLNDINFWRNKDVFC